MFSYFNLSPRRVVSPDSRSLTVIRSMADWRVWPHSLLPPTDIQAAISVSPAGYLGSITDVSLRKCLQTGESSSSAFLTMVNFLMSLGVNSIQTRASETNQQSQLRIGSLSLKLSSFGSTYSSRTCSLPLPIRSSKDPAISSTNPETRANFCCGRSVNLRSELWKKRLITWLQSALYLVGSICGSRSQMIVCEHKKQQKSNFFTKAMQFSRLMRYVCSTSFDSSCRKETSSAGMLRLTLRSSSRSAVSLFLQNCHAFSWSPLRPRRETAAWNDTRKGPKKRTSWLRMSRKRGCLLYSNRSFSYQKLQMQQRCRLCSISAPVQTLPQNCFLYPSSCSAKQMRMRARCSSSGLSASNRLTLLSWLEKMSQLTCWKFTAGLFFTGFIPSLPRNFRKFSRGHFQRLSTQSIVYRKFQAYR